MLGHKKASISLKGLKSYHLYSLITTEEKESETKLEIREIQLCGK